MTVALIVVVWLLIGGLSNYWSDRRFQIALNQKYPSVAKPLKVSVGWLLLGMFLGPLFLPAALFVRPGLFGSLEL
jgi:hypothetical protein